MKLFVAGFCASLACSVGTAQADWDGFYGGALISANRADAFDLTFGVPFEPDGASFGAFAGYNQSFQSLVLGIEVLGQFGGPEGSDGAFLLPLTFKNTIALRGRVGYDGGKFLPYAAIGLVRSQIEADHAGSGAAADFAETTLSGRTFALGVDYAVTDRSFLRLEVSHTDYSNDVLPFYNGTDPHDFSADTTSLSIGYAFRF